MKKIRVFVVLFTLIWLFVLPVSAQSVEKNNMKIDVDIPGNFISITEQELEKDTSVFDQVPISKKQAIENFRNGMVINAFLVSSDPLKQQEVRLKIWEDDFSYNLGNLTPLQPSEQKSVLETVCSGVKSVRNAEVTASEIIKQGDFSFLKYSVKAGGDNGFSYTALTTMIDGRHYELTCYNSVNQLSDEQTATNNKILNSFKIISIEAAEAGKEQILQTVFSILAIIAAVSAIVFVVYTFIKDYKKRKQQDEPLKTHWKK